MRRSVKIVDMLLLNGADVNAQSNVCDYITFYTTKNSIVDTFY